MRSKYVKEVSEIDSYESEIEAEDCAEYSKVLVLNKSDAKIDDHKRIWSFRKDDL